MRKNNSFIGKEASVTTTNASGISSNINKFNYTKGGVWPYTLLNNVPPLVEYLVVAGGGGGGSNYGGGGGAGGFRTGFYQITPETRTNSFNIIVGLAGLYTASRPGRNGGDSRFGSIHSVGGGGGWGQETNPFTPQFTSNASQGGSGGGGSFQNGNSNASMAGGPGISGQGYSGGFGRLVFPGGGAGGGGGAKGAGGNISSTSAPFLLGNGGLCETSSITGTSVEYAGGGGGAGYGAVQNSVGGGAGAGAGNNGFNNASDGYPATIQNRGSGGGGGWGSGANGSKGVVILAYPTAFAAITTITNLTYSVSTASRPGYYVYTFTAHSGSGGTIAWS